MSALDKDGRLDIDEFVIMIHILFTCCNRVPLPQELPASLIPPSKIHFASNILVETVIPNPLVPLLSSGMVPRPRPKYRPEMEPKSSMVCDPFIGNSDDRQKCNPFFNKCGGLNYCQYNKVDQYENRNARTQSEEESGMEYIYVSETDSSSSSSSSSSEVDTTIFTLSDICGMQMEQPLDSIPFLLYLDVSFILTDLAN